MNWHLWMLCMVFLLGAGCQTDDDNVQKEPEENEQGGENPDEETDPEKEPTTADFENMDPDLPSFVSIDDTTPEDMQWIKVDGLTDEFDSWDEIKWFKPLWNYDVPVQMKAENSGVADGNLWIKATLDEGAERWFETSRVQSKEQISYPMYTESRIRTAHISAYNTFWLNNGDISNRNEIDVIENNSKPSCGCQPDFPWQMNSQYFHVIDDDTRREKGNFDNRNLSNANPGKGIKWNEEYHIVGVWWKDATHIQFYLDGEPAGSVVSERDFTRDLNLIWDLWTFDADWLGGLAKKEDLLDDSINTMKVDWVRTWKLEPTQ
ncbi:LamG domain-containing protein [Salegentibacter agarivorans]|nr:family 16 glycosylhydrolase [Salegentibacter agarivorans]